MQGDLGDGGYGAVPFRSVVLRFAPDPYGGDFVNVAVALHAPDAAFLGMRMADIVNHLRDLLPGVDQDELQRQLEFVEASLTALGPEKIAGGDLSVLAERALPPGSIYLRWSAPSIGVTADPRAELHAICRDLIAGQAGSFADLG